MNHRHKHALVNKLIFSLTVIPLLGHLATVNAQAQIVQNTTYTFGYDSMGNTTQITDALGNVSNFSYDPLLRLKQAVQPVPVSGVARPTSNFTYDGLDQPATVVDPRSLTTTYTSDGLGNRTGLASPDTGATTQTYDANGNLKTSTDARGKLTTYAYDALNRLTTVTYASGTPTVFEYDGGAAGAPYAIGHLTKISDESGQTVLGYDQAGRVLSKAQTTVSATGTVIRQLSYAYSTNGQLQSVTYPSGNRVNYAYDSAGRVKQLTLSPADGSGGTDSSVPTLLLDQISYAPFGTAQSWAWGNSSETMPNLYARTFDLDGRVATYPLGNPALSQQAVSRTVAYDAASRITGYTHTGAANAVSYDQTFGYDGVGRLTSFINATGSQSYGYDASGNRIRLSIGATSFTNTIAVSSNRLTNTSGPAPAKSNAIDNAGNLTSDGVSSFIYSDRGRLKSATKAGYTTSYLYNGLGQRVSKTGAAVASGGMEFVYDEAGRLIGEYDANGGLVQETVWLGELPVVVLKPSAAGAVPAVKFVYADHLGTPRAIADATGALVWRWIDADPFGMVQPNEAAISGEGLVYNGRFPGQYFDRETGLHYNYFRDYDPAFGRYIQSDPIGLHGGINTYGYAGANPLSNVDPDGRFFFLLLAGPSVAAAVGDLAIMGSLVWATNNARKGPMASSSDPDLQKAIESKANYREYKSYCDDPPPPGGNSCDDAQNELRNARMCKAAREENTKKWWGGVDKQYSPQMVRDLDNRIANAERAVRNKCPATCN